MLISSTCDSIESIHLLKEKCYGRDISRNGEIFGIVFLGFCEKLGV